MKKLLTVLLVCLLAASFCFANGDKDAAATGTGAYKDTAVIGFQSKTSSINPTAQSNVAHKIFFGLTHNTLVGYDEATAEILPELATAWESQDFKTWTFTLRDDVLFHNGEKFTAKDVAYTFEYGKTATNATVKSFYNSIASVKVIDDTHVQLVLKEANIDFLFLLSNEYLGILNEKAIKADAANGAGIGTGPYVNKEFVVADHTTLEAFDQYWGGVSPTKTLLFRYISDGTTRLAALEAGEIDVCQGTNNTEIGLVKRNDDLAITQYPGTALTYLAFNLDDPILQDKNLRLAIAYAINDQEIIDGAASGCGTVAYTPWGLTQFGYFDDFKSVGLTAYNPQNIEIAKQYLAKSKYPNGGLTLKFTASSAWTVGSLQIIQSQLRALGINVEVEQTDTAGFTAKTNSRDFQVCIYSITFTGAGSDAARMFTKGSTANQANYDNAQVADLFKKASAESDQAKRLEYYKQIQTILHEEAPYIPLYYADGNASYNKNVEGVIWNNSGRYDYTTIKVAAN